MAVAAVTASTPGANANIVISSGQTENMICSAGVCTQTAKDAILNVNDLENLLAAGNIEILGQGTHARAKTTAVEVPLSWSAPSVLSTVATRLHVDSTIAVQGSGGISINYGLSFGTKGRITFAETNAIFEINGAPYTLASTLPGLASAIAANPKGLFALGDSYDASQDGTYSQSPIPTNFEAGFLGLGNAISNISINNTAACCVGGLFETISQGQVSNIRLENVAIVSAAGAGGLAYENFGAVSRVSVTGTVSGGADAIGGLIGVNYSSISSSSSRVVVSADGTANGIDIGGLVGAEFGETEYSFATGAVSSGNGSGNIGGLIGEIENGNSGDENSYASGAVSGGSGWNVGGLIGQNDYGSSNLLDCYSIGEVSGGSGSIVGGLIGVNNSTSEYKDYWDTTTSGTYVGVGLGNDAYVTGLTTAQLQSGLPSGFEPKVWAEKASINGGLPYLRRNPPSR